MRFLLLKPYVALAALWVSLAACSQAKKTAASVDAAGGRHTFRYTNPITRDTAISMRDHFIIKVGRQWFATGTSMPVWSGPNPGVRLLVSDDLIHWRQHSWLIDGKKLPASCPYNGRFWAPEIHYIQKKYWLTVNSGQVTAEDPKGMKTHSVWLFSSDKVTGPYKLVNGPLTPHYNNDATLFEDEDGQTYLYCSGNGLWQAKIDLPTGKLVGEIKQFRGAKDANNPGWMVGGIEGPFVLKRDGTYFMFFSTWTRGYEVGLLRSKSPLGPWELAAPEPIFGTRKREYRAEMARNGGLQPPAVHRYSRPLPGNRPQRHFRRARRAIVELLPLLLRPAPSVAGRLAESTPVGHRAPALPQRHFRNRRPHLDRTNRAPLRQVSMSAGLA
ncbi:family 43 glycosylhydrolase [Hymenobacter monticola]|uniref:Family 43 glycosylhydrolase n=1 Tax=Hymenobacter monticola TaxID=1705399 RepID=A0ABY4AZW2_9BACT|nr:family 43 glycosylhydrolase [Hymenobacter monticola]UOE32450.1 family 43 glycosylhydrolase [Hymenobacter monticola]